MSLTPEEIFQLEYKKHHWFRVTLGVIVVIAVAFSIKVGIDRNRPRLVFACPYGIAKCYELKADYRHKECDGESHCEPETYTRMYFSDGGSVSFDWCEESTKKNTLTCYVDSDNSSFWDLTFTGNYAD